VVLLGAVGGTVFAVTRPRPEEAPPKVAVSEIKPPEVKAPEVKPPEVKGAEVAVNEVKPPDVKPPDARPPEAVHRKARLEFRIRPYAEVYLDGRRLGE